MSIQKIEAHSPEAQSADLIADNIAKLKAMFPELLTETTQGGKTTASLNTEVLKNLVGDATAADSEEKYGLNWHGKRKARQIGAGKRHRDADPMFSGDIGFRTFKLDTSNIRAWNPNASDLAGSLLANLEHIEDGRSENDVLYEVLIKLGLDLCTHADLREIAGKPVHSIGGGTLMACLDEHISAVDAEPLALGIAAWREEQATAGATTAVFRDSAFENDVAKSNLAAILEQHGVKHVRSL